MNRDKQYIERDIEHVTILTIYRIYSYTYYKCKKLQFIHTVNGDGSKTAKIIKRQC